jgi:hypothetical protein
LDYTNNFGGNKSPDEFLFNFLADLYGSVDGSRAHNITTSSTDATSDGTTDGGTNTGTTANQSPGGRRNLRYSTTKQDGNLQAFDLHLFSSVIDESKRRDLTNRWSEIDASVLRGFV